jgi:hypothetical protein
MEKVVVIFSYQFQAMLPAIVVDAVARDDFIKSCGVGTETRFARVPNAAEIPLIGDVKPERGYPRDEAFDGISIGDF